MSCLINYSKVMDLVLDTDYLIVKLTAMKFQRQICFYLCLSYNSYCIFIVDNLLVVKNKE